MAVPNQDQFELYFKRADLDGDGKISGAEAVAFFQGSNLSKQVLAQIWMHADQNRVGFLGRQEFFNALKLVTVAQSKRDLTPDIVKAALFGPAAAKIPPPQINLPASPVQQINSMVAASVPRMSEQPQMGSQNFVFRGPGVPNMSQGQMSMPTRPFEAAVRPPQSTVGQDFSRGGSLVGQSQIMPAGSAPYLHQPMPYSTAGPSVPTSNISSGWLGGGMSGASTGLRAVTPSTPSTASNSLTPVSSTLQPMNNDSKALASSGNGFISDSGFGGDVFTAHPTAPKQRPSMSTYSASSSPTLSANVSVSSAAQPSAKPNALDSLQSAYTLPAGSQQTQSSLGPGQQVPVQSSSSFPSAGISVGAGNSASDNSQPQWPKMKQSDVQKYMKVFMQVDTDRDGRITGEQARNLFMSWRLPREVLKQVWDLSDQDSDSILSLREFCYALYLMERYKEGRSLPAVLPRNIMFDEALLSMTGQAPNASYGNAAWGTAAGLGQQQMMSARSMTPGGAFRPPNLVTPPTADGAKMSNQQKSGAPVLDNSFANQLVNGEQNAADSRHQEGTNDGKKVDEREKTILDSREKIEFYRSKMQELVLYKSRCENRLNEITERAIADKRESETLGKKYEEKYKQVAEVASKLTIEEAKFRELQERKMELHQAIVNMEQGGSADGLLQVRADRIQSDLEELLKLLTERCKKHAIDVKSSSVIELPFGWQPGIQEGAAVWDEDWDKFEDEGFGNELTFDRKNAPASTNMNSSVQMDNASPDGSYTPDFFSNGGEKPRELMNTVDRAFEGESGYAHSEDELVRSPHSSPAGKAAPESPPKEFSDVFRSSEADEETHRSFDDSNWGAFDNDDTDSVWGFNPVNTKGLDSDKNRDFFGSSSFDVSSIRTESPSADSTFHKKSPFAFDESVPSTPLSRFGNSPPRYSEASTDHFDSFSRFDSFNMHDSGFSSQTERFSRFDSMNSTNNFGPFSSQPERFSRFDSMNSTTDFGSFVSQPDKFSRVDSMNSSKDFGGDRFARFDSMNSSKDFGNSHGFYSFDDSDAFGSSGPFKALDSNSRDKSPRESNSTNKF